MTTTNGVASWRLMSDKIDGFDLSPADMTAVDSGRRGLQFLGLDEEQSASGFDVNEFDNHRLLCAWNDRIRVA
ncbi:hypothetical protein WN943_006100 [Citrus x changshan-huyou]